MPSWLVLALFTVGCIVLTGLQGAGAMGSWRGFWILAKQFALVLLALALPAIVVTGCLFIWPPVP